MINLIGTDVGDASLLVTPSKVLSTSINQVVAGFVTLSGQTIQLEDGTSVSPSLSFDSQTNLGLYKQGTDTLGVNKNLFVGGNLTVDGDITFRAGNGSGGTLTFGDLDTDNIILNADLNSHIIPNIDNTYDLGTSSKEWRNIWIDGTATVDTLQVDETATVTGNLAVNSGNITTTSGTVNLFNNTASSVFAFGEATNIKMGALNSAFEVGSSVVKSTAISLQLYNVNTTSVTAFSVASGIVFGYAAPSGVPNTNFTVRSDDTILDGDLNVNGGEILSSQNTFKLLTNNSDVRIGSSTGSTLINNSLKVNGNTIDLTNQGVNISLKDNINPALTIKEGSNDYLTIQTSDSLEKIILHKDVYIPTNKSITFGDLSESTIRWNGTQLLISETGSAGVNILTSQFIASSSTGEFMINAIENDSVYLYYDNSIKLQTTSTGVTVNGTISASAVTSSGNISAVGIVSASGITSTTSISAATASFTGNVTTSGLTVNGDLVVNGTTTTVNSTVLTIDDPLIVLGDGQTTATGVNTGGFTLGTTGIGIQYNNANTRFDCTEDLNIASGKVYRINGTNVLSNTTVLGRTIGGTLVGDIVSIDGTQTLTNKAFGSSSSSTDFDTIFDAGAFSIFAYTQSASGTARTINISNLTSGRMVKIYLRNTNAATKIINIAASTTNSGWTAVNLSKGDAGGTSVTSVTLAASSGTAVVMVFNANGIIGGSIS